MNSKFVKKVLILVSSFVAQAALPNIAHPADTLSGLAAYRKVGRGDAGTADRYMLPPSKVYIESCQREALLLHPGAIEKQQMLHRHGDFWVRYEIQAHDVSEWFVLCDLATGRVTRKHQLIDDVF
jgi:hypothetical protein